MTRKKLTEGKTKIVWLDHADAKMVIVESKDDLTAGDGAKHDLLAGKAKLATHTTCNVFRLLKQCGVPLAFKKQLSDTAFLAERCDMIPLEVVVRREAHGSYLKRMPHLNRGQLFPRLLVEFYLKTAGKVWNGQPLEVDDPLMIRRGRDLVDLYRPDRPFAGAKPFLTIKDAPLFAPLSYDDLAEQARRIFLALEKAWQLQGRRLVDMKVEFGQNARGNIVLSDVIDNDSWRVVEGSAYIDKQVYRDGGALSAVLERYKQVAELTSRFEVPKQSIVIWTGSASDNVSELTGAYHAFCQPFQCELHSIVCSMHKQPQLGLRKLNEWLREYPDTVVVVYVGLSNGAGPTLSANVSVPVISVPAGYKQFPEDVMSSLRLPSAVPTSTNLEPRNAMLNALQILAMRNPALYANLRLNQEGRLCNVIYLD
jgi:phosphoribosylaminoimidazole carboxylase/phosphoribosylaminoimidazole-succinocarboxamide synthase